MQISEEDEIEEDEDSGKELIGANVGTKKERKRFDDYMDDEEEGIKIKRTPTEEDLYW